MGWRSVLVPVMIMGVCVVAVAQTPSSGTPDLGRIATEKEIRAWDIAIGPDGKELPLGSGTAIQGAALFGQRGCVRCHGPNQIEGPAPRLVGGEVLPNTSYYPIPYWPFAPSIWDFINRAMPMDRPGYLSADEVYALTAFLLFRNGIIQETDLMDAKSLPKVQMPNRDRYTAPPEEWKAGKPRPFVLKP